MNASGLLEGFAIGVTADRRADEQISLFQGRGAECLHGATVRTHPIRPEAEIREGLEGNLCRCTGYHNIVKAVQSAAGGAS